MHGQTTYCNRLRVAGLEAMATLFKWYNMLVQSGGGGGGLHESERVNDAGHAVAASVEDAFDRDEFLPWQRAFRFVCPQWPDLACRREVWDLTVSLANKLRTK